MGVCGCCLSRTIPPSAFGSHLPLHKGGTVGSPFIPCVTVLFAPTIASLREVAKRREGSVEPERDRAAARRWTAIAGEGESGINGYRSLYSEHNPSFADEGVKRVLNAYTALSLSHLRCQLSPGESLGLSILFVWCVPVGFVRIGYFHGTGDPSPTDDRTFGALPVLFAHTP